MAKAFWNLLGKVANILQVAGGVPEPFRSWLQKIINGALALAAITLLQHWFEAFSRLDPALRWLCAAAIVFIIAWSLVALATFWTRVRSPRDSTEHTAAEKVLDRSPSRVVGDPAALGPDEILHINVLWSWDRMRHQCLGPFCPFHRTPLLYQSSGGSSTLATDFEEKLLGGSGWFVCSTDNRTFASTERGTINQIRETAENFLLSKLRMPPREIPEQERLIREGEPAITAHTMGILQDQFLSPWVQKAGAYVSRRSPQIDWQQSGTLIERARVIMAALKGQPYVPTTPPPPLELVRRQGSDVATAFEAPGSGLFGGFVIALLLPKLRSLLQHGKDLAQDPKESDVQNWVQTTVSLIEKDVNKLEARFFMGECGRLTSPAERVACHLDRLEKIIKRLDQPSS